MVHAFIDESRRRGVSFVSCVEVAASEIAMVRRRLRACVLPGQRRLHVVDERGHRRRRLLAEFGRQPIRGAVIAVPLGVGSETEARRRALGRIVAELAPDVDHLVVESRQGRDRDDRRVIAAELRSLQRDRPLRDDHGQPFEEPGLWLPDGFAWAAGAGREWRQRLEEIGVAITRIGP